jgi:prevent-host-death family protein
MCYMSATSSAAVPRPTPLGRVGVRELRQNLSVYLERVVAGESLEVTDRGQAVAMLVPLRPGATLVDRLVASGRAIPARRRLEDVPRLEGRIPSDLGERAQRALQELREDKV